MPHPNVIVTGIRSFEPDLREFSTESFRRLKAPLKVLFDNEDVGYLDPHRELSETYGHVLDHLYRALLPAYVEFDPQRRMIVDVQVPVTGHVLSLRTDKEEGVTIALDSSERLHTLRRSNERFAEFHRILLEAEERHAMIALTERDEDEEIVDIRFAPNPPGPALLRAPQRTPALLAAVPLRPVTLSRARALFRLVKAESCPPRTGAPPCIPFLFVKYGCHARAHEMCRLIMAAGDEPGKIWNFENGGPLLVQTPNEPQCQASWWFHVAPVLRVTTSGGSPQRRVLDPSLFTGPVTVASWLRKQGNPNSRQEFTSPAPFLPLSLPPAQFDDDPTYSQTAQKLAECRAQLRRRCGANGPPPPPYAHCP